MNLREAAQQALEALEGIHPGNMTPMAEEYWNKAITALRTALAEPERKPLTDEQICGAFRKAGLEAYHQRDAVVEMKYDRRINAFARAIERAHGIGGEA
jgi:hypothetical protein